ncbi:hypothetical protein GO730_34915 [Spirosoma sp. HMF3257]|uniref:T9SS type A sorting domain-containing protein n=1 Tax=Spirosoma telluris TaxID=2183553 RepID=A0A327NRF7_9BACT|nr:hypothetical protein [Spirosoma telluris]RAI77981.1 hypothetical protein HMF3257_34815 [Spirosoma telluris]
MDGQIRFVYRNIDPQSIQLQTHAGVPVPGHVIRESEMNAVFIPNQPLSTGLYLLKSQNGMQTIKLIVL